VKVLKMKDAKDPDEFLHKFGPDRFKLLLEEAGNRVEYQLAAIAGKYNISIDEERVKFIQEAAELICSLPSAVQREIYGHRVAEAGKITYDALKIEIDKAYRRRKERAKKQQERQDLQPVRNLQPKTRAFHYTNMKSAMAEESILAMVLTEPALFDQTAGLTAEMFSASVLGRAFSQLRQRYEQGLEVSPGVLEGFSPEEMSHLVGITQRLDGPVNQTALLDCIRIVREKHQSGAVASDNDLRAMQSKLKERKGLN
jgi:DNA primase